jgi:hypothetical protein
MPYFRIGTRGTLSFIGERRREGDCGFVPGLGRKELDGTPLVGAKGLERGANLACARHAGDNHGPARGRLDASDVLASEVVLQL